MAKKIALAAAAVFLVGGIALFFWARFVFFGDFVRTEVADQISQAIGHPVTIDRMGVRLFPRVTVDLGTVTIGESAEIQVETLQFGTNLRGLLSRRIEGANLQVDGARVKLPLLPLGAAPPSAGGSPSRPAGGTSGAGASRPPGSGAPDAPAREPPVRIVSIDDIALRDVEFISGGMTLRADIDAALQGDGAVLRRVAIAAGDTSLEATGEITSLAELVGNLSVTGGTIDLDRLLLFLGAFAGGVEGRALSPGQTGLAAEAKASALRRAARLDVSLAVDRARSGALMLDKLTGRALVTNEGVTIDPISFGLFDGRYDGTLAVSLADTTPTFRGTASVSNIDMAELVAHAGSPGTISGRMAGTIDLAGSGADLATATRSARGTARVDVTDGEIPHLDLVRNLVLATSGRADSTAQAAASNTAGEKFTRLGATLAVANGLARTNDLTFESPDVRLSAQGAVALDGSDVKLAGLAQLSEALSTQAGRDLVRYTAQDGRVTLPATVTGPPSNLKVGVNVADLAERAIKNKATEEINRAIERNLGSLFKRPPK